MNERYLYRGKRKDNGEWAYGGLDTDWGLEPEQRDRYWIIQAYLGETLVIPETVGQCTGLRDKNGKLIFEGDLLRFTNTDNEQSIYKVFYDDVYAGWRIQEIGCLWLDEMNGWESSREYFELIGSAYDNPELLEVEK